jgi:SAM-dependent methyltransferase
MDDFQTPLTSRREQLLCARATLSGAGLEIGAADHPIVSSGCYYLDYADTETLRQRFSDSLYQGANNIVPVDYVWSGSGSLLDVVGEQRFDYVIASHVIEHVPNPLGWFRGIIEVMKPGAIFNLAIPDRRFTFDVAAPESTVGEMVEAFLLNYTRPSPRQIFDFCYYGKAIDPGAIWARAIDVASTPAYSGSIATQLAFDNAVRSMTGLYFDTHCWIVTPSSFLSLLEGVCQLGLFDYLLEDFHPTCAGEFEFFLCVRKPEQDMLRNSLIDHQLARIAFFRKAIAERRRDLLLLAE